MKSYQLCHIISLLFIILMSFKTVSSVVGLFSSERSTFVSELLADMEQEQEKKGSRTVESINAEEVFEGSAFLDVTILSGDSNPDRVQRVDVLPDVYLDTLTPPPNISSC